MGIWGNASLIRMQLNPEDERFPRVVQMERLIQSGGFLIHMVLGYLGERRTVAKRIRLNQLISEIKSQAYSTSSDDEGDQWNFEARLKWASRVQRPRNDCEQYRQGARSPSSAALKANTKRC